MKKCLVKLTEEERGRLQRLLAVEQAPTGKLTHARILLKADESEGSPGRPDEYEGDP